MTVTFIDFIRQNHILQVHGGEQLLLNYFLRKIKDGRCSPFLIFEMATTGATWGIGIKVCCYMQTVWNDNVRSVIK
jgi:hypothetical protein